MLFGSYGLTARALGVDRNQLSLGQVFFCGSVAGLACCNISVPTELLKIRAQTVKSAAEVQKGATSTWLEGKRLVRAHGPSVLFRVGWRRPRVAADLPGLERAREEKRR